MITYSTDHGKTFRKAPDGLEVRVEGDFDAGYHDEILSMLSVSFLEDSICQKAIDEDGIVVAQKEDCLTDVVEDLMMEHSV